METAELFTVPTMRDCLQRAVAAGALRPVDFHFARHLVALADRDDPQLWLAAALVSQRVGEGDVCLDLNLATAPSALLSAGSEQLPFTPPVPEHWINTLRQLPVIGQPGTRAPLILDAAGRLYLGRYWQFESDVITALQQRMGVWAVGVNQHLLRQGLEQLFPADAGEDWQRIAAALAVLRPLCLITGGPGTGKTRTVTAILALLLQQAGTHPPRIALAAPTGKAAARLTAAICAEKARLPLTEAQRQALPDAAQTLHRLLGFRPGRANPRHGREQPLPLDLLVVDEASMVDLPLMAHLLAALPSHARLILLGDPYQLTSVEAGRVLGDLCGQGRLLRYTADTCDVLAHTSGTRLLPGKLPPNLGEHIVMLRQNYRVARRSGLRALALAVNSGRSAQALRILTSAKHPDVQLTTADPQALAQLIQEQVVPAWQEILHAASATAALAALQRLCVLCAVRDGPQGLETLNHRIQQALAAAGMIQPASAAFYAGRPVLVTVNDHAQRLYNGDVGLVCPDPDHAGALRVFFPEGDGVRRLVPSRLPPHETVYAMTVHKSQGSEFERVLLVLPEMESRLLTRELVYTGITRARQGLIIASSKEHLCTAITRRVTRTSGLFDALWRVGSSF